MSDKAFSHILADYRYLASFEKKSHVNLQLSNPYLLETTHKHRLLNSVGVWRSEIKLFPSFPLRQDNRP